MHKLLDFGLIGVDNARTRAYLQLLLEKDYRLHMCYIMTIDPTATEVAASEYEDSVYTTSYFRREEPVLYTLKKAGIPYKLIQTDNINSPSSIYAISEAEESYLIYSGFGGQIIKKEVFDTGKILIHVHSGILPQYRGSTTVYYSLLQEEFCGASAIVMTPGLDKGDVIAESRFPMPPKGVDIDYVYDPYIRAKVLTMAVEHYLTTGTFTRRVQGTEGERTYFIAHPVLRHIVRLMQDTGGEEFEDSLQLWDH